MIASSLRQNLMAEANQGCEGLLGAWAQLLDDHAWKIADDAGQSATDNTALLFRLNDVQVILDHVPWIRRDLVLAIYWLIRRDQLILNPNEQDRSFTGAERSLEGVGGGKPA